MVNDLIKVVDPVQKGLLYETLRKNANSEQYKSDHSAVNKQNESSRSKNNLIC